jgi:hypothetical protein
MEGYYPGMAKDVLPPAARQALERGNPIEAIKILREQSGLGLAEAKGIVDQIRKALPDVGSVPRAHLPPTARSRKGLGPGQVADGGGSGKWLVLIAIAAIVLLVALYF